MSSSKALPDLALLAAWQMPGTDVLPSLRAVADKAFAAGISHGEHSLLAKQRNCLSDAIRDGMAIEVPLTPTATSPSMPPASLPSLLDDFYQAIYDLNHGSSHDEVDKARVAINEHVAKLLADAEAKHHLIQDAAEEVNATFSTSLIRAAMASVLEAAPTTMGVRLGDKGVLSEVQVTLNLDAQRTIWDRYELSTRRTPDEQSVIFTLTSIQP